MIDHRLLLVLLAAIGLPAGADSGEGPGADRHVCLVLLDEARHQLANQAAQRDIDAVDADGAQQIFAMAEQLWKTKSLERLRYLGAEYLRDRTRLNIARTEILIDRSRVKRDVLLERCGPEAEEEERIDAAKASEGFASLGCRLVDHDAKMAKREVRYRKEVYASTRELRDLDLATADDLVKAEFQLKQSEILLKDRTARTRSCQP